MKIVTIIGARPQFIKAAAISRAIKKKNIASKYKINEVIVHTGQHFDKNMSEVFFTELGIPQPDYNLKIANMSHGAMTGRMLESIEEVLQELHPDVVLIYGDTNSTLAGALAASKMHIPIAHVEAGLRSFNTQMPEEINRVLADKVSDYLFCPTQTAVDNLNNEGIKLGVYNTGDVMYDTVLHYRKQAKKEFSLKRWGLEDRSYVLCTIHRAENTNDTTRLLSILEALREISKQIQVVLPIHPRTRHIINGLDDKNLLDQLIVLDPVSYLEMLRLEMSAKTILTDSGGVQKEAFFHGVPCISLRDETEWIETVAMGWNQVIGSDKNKIIEAFEVATNVPTCFNEYPYGKGKAAEDIIDVLLKHHHNL